MFSGQILKLFQALCICREPPHAQKKPTVANLYAALVISEVTC